MLRLPSAHSLYDAPSVFNVLTFLFVYTLIVLYTVMIYLVNVCCIAVLSLVPLVNNYVLLSTESADLLFLCFKLFFI